MQGPDWIIAGASVVQAVFAAPQFFAWIKTYRTPHMTNANVALTKMPSSIRLAAMFIILLTTWAAVIFYFTNKPFDPNAHLTQVFAQIYNDQTIDLDGYEYVGCTFTNVTFLYRGTAPFRLTDAHFPKNVPNRIQFTSPNPAIQNALQVVKMLASMPGGSHFMQAIPKGQFQ